MLKEPLLHFLIIGLVLFVTYNQLNENLTDDGKQVLITQSQVDRLIFQWSTRNGRPPTRKERDGLLENFIHQEILYREAIALGLEKGDVVVRRRLAQKMEYLFEDLSPVSEPEEKELIAYLKLNADQFEVSATLSFTHIYFNTDDDSVGAGARATALLSRLNNGEATPEYPGDRLLLPTEYLKVTQKQVEATFGQTFAKSLFAQPANQWKGPLESGYGIHLVRVENITSASTPLLTEVLDQVTREWRYEKEKLLRNAFIEGLRDRYEVTIEGEEPAG